MGIQYLHIQHTTCSFSPRLCYQCPSVGPSDAFLQVSRVTEGEAA